jgi:hypothetical protein
MHERDNDARARVADGVAERDGTAATDVSTAHTVCKQTEAYPLTLIFAGSMSRIFSAARTTTENASLISQSAMSFTSSCAFFNAFGRATVGAMGKSMGSVPASEKAG